MKLLPGGGEDIAFDPVRDLLYAANASPNQILVYDTNTYQLVGTINFGDNISGTSAFSNDEMVLSSDGSHLFLITASGVEEFNLPSALPPLAPVLVNPIANLTITENHALLIMQT